MLQCQTAIGMRREQEKRDYIKALIEEVKSAPNGEATPNGASNPETNTKTRYICILAISGRKAKRK